MFHARRNHAKFMALLMIFVSPSGSLFGADAVCAHRSSIDLSSFSNRLSAISDTISRNFKSCISKSKIKWNSFAPKTKFTIKLGSAIACGMSIGAAAAYVYNRSMYRTRLATLDTLSETPAELRLRPLLHTQVIPEHEQEIIRDFSRRIGILDTLLRGSRDLLQDEASILERPHRSGSETILAPPASSSASLEVSVQIHDASSEVAMTQVQEPEVDPRRQEEFDTQLAVLLRSIHDLQKGVESRKRSAEAELAERERGYMLLPSDVEDRSTTILKVYISARQEFANELQTLHEFVREWRLDEARHRLTTLQTKYPENNDLKVIATSLLMLSVVKTEPHIDI